MKRIIFTLAGIIVFVFSISLVLYKGSSPQKKIHGNEIESETRSEAWDALQFISTSRAFPNADIPADGYEKAFQFYSDNFAPGASRQSSVPATASWQSLGPNNIGGRTLGIAIHPIDTNIIWLGSASGGLWKSTTGGIGVNAWNYVPTGFPARGISCIALNPSNPDVMYIGTGETYSYGTAVNGLVTRPTRGTVGIGILKSVDGGVTWTQSLNWSYNQLRGIWDLKINPLNPNIVYAATTEGVYKTVDAGITWVNVLPLQMIMDLEIDKVDTNIVYAGVGNVTSANKGIYKTSNSGATWAQLTNGLPPATNQGRITITAYPKNNKILYALIADIYNTVGIYYSTNAGLSWTPKNIPFTEIVSYQGWYAKGLCVKSDDSSKSLYGGVYTFKSENFGNDINQVSFWDFVTDSVHPDIHEIVSNPLDPDKIYILNDGGLFRSDDFATTFYDCNNGYVTSQFYIGSVSSQDSLYMIAGAQDNFSSQYTGSLYWYSFLGGDGTFNAIDPNDDNIEYASYQYLNVIQTFDKWNSSSNQIIFTPSSPTGTNPAAFVAPFILCPSNSNSMYAGSNELTKSTDQGFNWTNLSGALADNGNVILTIAVSSTNEDSVYYATAPTDTTAMHVFRSGNSGATHTNISSGLPNRYPRQLAVNPHNSREIYIAYSGFGSGHVFKSTNAGTTWSDVSTSLPDVPFHTVLIVPDHPNVVYSGSDLGVFVSLDGGTTWNALNNGLPEGVMIFDLVYSPADNTVVAFTHGNGVYKISQDELPVDVFNPLHVRHFTQQIISNPVHNSLQLVINSNLAGKAEIEMYDLSGKKIKKSVDHSIIAGRNVIEFDVSSLSNGTYFIQTRFDGAVKVNKAVVLN